MDRAQIARDFDAVVNMTASELCDWLETEKSWAVGWKGADGARSESVGHASGRHILSIIGKSRHDLSADDYAHMQKTVSFIRRHRAQEPENPVTSRWRYSLMNWGHDPMKLLVKTGSSSPSEARRLQPWKSPFPDPKESRCR
ncbi:MAG: DUF3140 domain-containing protein [Sphingomonas sp.]|nr:DUF3140 domain-containing protein [Sphingomonas sp.]